MWAHKTVKALMLISLLVMALSFWRKDALPPGAQLRPELADEPKQVAVRDKAFRVNVEGVEYDIQPRFSYDLYGVVVELHHSDSWWEYAHAEWNDHVNIVDLCVVWGGSATSGVYRELSYEHTQWECWYRTSSREVFEQFSGNELSNNHLITEDARLAKKMKEVRIGDQVRFTGYLADYTTYMNGQATGTRTTSTVRTDSGEGACEVVYVTDLQVLRASNRPWRVAGKIAFWVFLAAAIAWVLLPVKFDD
jgi:hypothetical protein